MEFADHNEICILGYTTVLCNNTPFVKQKEILISGQFGWMTHCVEQSPC
jgi:hypothetical protein